MKFGFYSNLGSFYTTGLPPGVVGVPFFPINDRWMCGITPEKEWNRDCDRKNSSKNSNGRQSEALNSNGY